MANASGGTQLSVWECFEFRSCDTSKQAVCKSCRESRRYRKKNSQCDVLRVDQVIWGKKYTSYSSCAVLCQDITGIVLVFANFPHIDLDFVHN